MRLNSKQISLYTGGSFIVDPIDASKLACGICWDSRELVPDDVFVALPGQRVDGHRFVDDALRKGAAVVLVTDRPDAESCLLAKEMGAAIIEVSNSANAIADLAREWRARLRGHVIAITGSSGKTTTKNLVRDVLEASFSVVATSGNQNNELGVPKTILDADINTEVIVLEMGMRGFGQIRALCDLALPDMGIITNIGEAHLELLKTKENIARAKAELFCALPQNRGIAFMNRSDEYADFVSDLAQLESRQVRLVYYDVLEEAGSKPDPANSDGFEKEYGVQGAWADGVILDPSGCPCFTLHLGEEEIAATLPLRGIHNVYNAVSAASVGAVLGMDLETIVAALKKARIECGRQELVKARGGFTIINDSYNANPDSMRAALMMFSSMEVEGRRVAVLGDMAELGDAAYACHERIGELLAGLPIDQLICIGDLSCAIVSTAAKHGMEDKKITHLRSIPAILEELETSLRPGDAVLVKGSRCMGLERVVGGLIN
ncbi:MAG: UDP-N-acetylmuramoyl-tripeptide--D-alanyl-D-alanine ligase [Eggerthellaceae bacterium]|nr:UDP-N-acetylmuramoyl-tripeptide--D-alanyl-D-alanine ligase [Eggerthellaceae bacterium]